MDRSFISLLTVNFNIHENININKNININVDMNMNVRENKYSWGRGITSEYDARLGEGGKGVPREKIGMSVPFPSPI